MDKFYIQGQRIWKMDPTLNKNVWNNFLKFYTSDISREAGTEKNVRLWNLFIFGLIILL